MSQDDFYSALKKGQTITTSQADMEKIYQDVEDAFKAGKDSLYICFSKELSGTYNTTRIIAKEMEEKYPERRFETIDTFCATRAQGVLVDMALKMKKDGKSLDEIIGVIEVEKDKMYHFFTVDDLMHLKRGGRLSSTSAIVGTLVGIKPVLHMSDDGKLIPIAKIRGRHHALDEIVKMALDKIDASSKEVFVVDVGNLEDSMYVKKQLENNGIKNITLYTLGPVIATHVGIGTVGILFHSDK